MSDPFGLLGVAPDASLDDVRAARRRLAKALHPDRPGGGDVVAMGEVNRAFDHAVRAIRSRAAAGPRAAPPTPPTASTPSPGATRPARHGPAPRRTGWVEHDTPSFTVDARPAETYEALLVVTTWLGELTVDEPPYALEAVLDAPVRCWCRLELLPEAGASMVSVAVAAIEDGPWPPPSADQVRDAWVDALNRLGD